MNQLLRVGKIVLIILQMLYPSSTQDKESLHSKVSAPSQASPKVYMLLASLCMAPSE
jgi:hypothetical protein